MQHRRVCAIAGLVALLPAAASLLAQGGAQTPQILVETVYPRHAARGRTSVLSVAIPSRDLVQSAEISPAGGVTITGIKGTGSETEQAVGWWEVTLDVAGDATPGDRSLVLVLRTGRTVPARISIPTHMPAIAGLRIAPSPSGAGMLDVTMSTADAAGDLGESPYVWYAAACGGEPVVGAVRGHSNAGVTHAALPNPRTGAAPASGRCDFQVRLTDALGIDSNTMKTTADVASPPSTPPAPAPVAVSAGEWTEYMGRDDCFTITFPGQPTVTETTWTSQYSAVLPARVYSGAQGAGRYSVTVIDYNPIERLLSERSRTLPALDLAIHAYGLGYWKTDVRGAAVYAMSKFLARNAKVTSVASNFSDLVAGLVLDLTNTADQSRTYASIYMHENRLVITEATVPRSAPPPTIFQQSLGWLDEKGTKIRYQLMYYNEPDAPRPPFQTR